MLSRAGGLVALAIVLVIVGPPMSPIQPTYATSGSMTPAIEEGDLYVVASTGTPEVGDVVTFYSTVEGGYVTHRIVGETDGRYVTKGDANPTTDQAGALPPVSRSAIIGTVLEWNGRPITISGAGAGLAFFQTHRIAMLWLAGAVVVLPELADILGGGDRNVNDERILRVKDVVVPMFVLGLVLCVALMVLGVSTHEMTWVAVSADAAGGPQTVPVGESVTRTVDVHVSALATAWVVIETEGVEVVDRHPTGSGSIELTVSLPALDARGPYQSRARVYTYPPTLPRGVIVWLHDVHWVAATTASLGAVFVPLWLVYVLAFDGQTPIRRGRSRWLNRFLEGE